MSQVAVSGGFLVPPRPASAFDTASPQDWAWLDSKTTAHPLACFIQAIRLTGRYSEVARHIYVYAEGGICDGTGAVLVFLAPRATRALNGLVYD